MKPIILILIFIVFAAASLTASLILAKKESVQKFAVECFHEEHSCGIYEVLVEEKFDDTTLGHNLDLLNSESDSIDDLSRKRGMIIVKYLRTLSYQQRLTFIEDVRRKAGDD